MTWNTRGAGGASFRRLLGDIITRRGVNFFALLEPRQIGTRANAIAKKLGWEHMYVVEAKGFSGGIWLFWDSTFNFSVTESGDQFIHGIVNKGKSDEWTLTIVYGHPNIVNRRGLWPILEGLQQLTVGGWVVIGDFNVVSCPEERWSKDHRKSSIIDKSFRNWISNSKLCDIGFNGPQFTWANSTSQSRIDRALVDKCWLTKYPNATVTHLPKFKSDHCPVLVDTDPHVFTAKKRRPFRFFAPWVMHDDFKTFVQARWGVKEDWCGSVKEFTEDLRLWNKEVFGNISYMKDKLYRRLDGINAKMGSTGISNSLEKLRGDLWKELEKLLAQEEVMWLQYSRTAWYVDGDRNTKYFHSVANGRRRKNRIEALKLDSGEWTYDAMDIMKMGTSFFKELYTETHMYTRSLVFGCTYPEIDVVNLRSLGRSVEDNEIKGALFDMGPLKAPGPDGFNPLFYQSQWDTVGKSVLDLVNKIFNDPSLIR